MPYLRRKTFAAMFCSAMLIQPVVSAALTPSKGYRQLNLPGCSLFGPGAQPIAQPAKPTQVPVAKLMPNGLRLADHQVFVTSAYEPTDWVAFASAKLQRWTEISASEVCTSASPPFGERIVDDLPLGILYGEKRIVDGRSVRVVRFSFVATNPTSAIGNRYTVTVAGPSASTAEAIGVARSVIKTGIRAFPIPAGMTLRHQGLRRADRVEERQIFTFRPGGLKDPFGAEVVIQSGPGPLLFDSLSVREVQLPGRIVGYESARSVDFYRVTRSLGGVVVSVSARGLPFKNVQQIASSLRLLDTAEAQRQLGVEIVSATIPQPPAPLLPALPPVSYPGTLTSGTLTSVTLPPVVVAPPPTIPAPIVPLPSVPPAVGPATTAMPLSDQNGGPLVVSGKVGTTSWFIRAQIIPGTPDMCTLFRENDQPLGFTGGLPCEGRGGTTRSGIVSLTAFKGAAATYLQITTGPEIRQIRLTGPNGTAETTATAHPAGTATTTRLALAVIDTEVTEIQAVDVAGAVIAKLTGVIRPGLAGGWQFR